MQIKPNHIRVTINGVSYTDKTPFPFNFNQLLDKQLDESMLEILQIDTPIFKPITTAIIELWNGEEKQDKSNVLKLRYIITSDKSNEIPAGSGKYNHQLALIEETKYLECFIVRSCGFVNPLRKAYAQIYVVPNVYQTDGSPGGDVLLNENDIAYRPESPLKLGEQPFTFASWRNVVNRYSSALAGLNWDGSVELLNANGEVLQKQDDLDNPFEVSIGSIGPYLLRYNVYLGVVSDAPTSYWWNVDYAIYVE